MDWEKHTGEFSLSGISDHRGGQNSRRHILKDHISVLDGFKV